MIKKQNIILLIITISTCLSFAQTDSAKVIQTVNRLFDGIRTGNAELVSSVFDTTAVLMSIGNSLGRISVHSQTAEQFIEAVKIQHREEWDERIFDPVIKIKGEIAAVWAEYSFYLGNKLHHCGIDSFQLVRRNYGWKILVIVDTRKREGCEK